MVIKFKRGTKAELDTAASSSELEQSEPYLITDEDRIAIGKSVTAYEPMAKQSELINYTTTATVTLTVAGWSANSQTLTVTGVTASSLNIIVIESSTMGDRWAAAKVYATSQGVNSITFTCQTTPTENIEFKVTIIK